MTVHVVTCQQCGVVFQASRPVNKPAPKFCSQSCKAESQRGHAWGWGKPKHQGESRPRPDLQGPNSLTISAKQRVESKTGLPFADAVRDLYVARQMTIGEIATFAGTGHRTARKWLDDVGIPRRSPSEEKALKMANLTPDERESVMRGCRVATRGMKQTDEHRHKIARTKQDRAVLSDDESEIMGALNAVGLNPIPLYAVHRYNIDFAFPDVKLAIEYNGGNWHNTPKKRRGDEIKTAYLESQGWTVVYFPRLAKDRWVDSGNERITLDDLVSEVRRLILHLTPLRAA